MIQEYLLVPLVEEFIRKSASAKRLNANGKKITEGTIENYRYTLQHLKGYEAKVGQPVRIKAVNKLSKQQLLTEKKYWKKFYLQFSDYLYKEGCFDNYTGSIMKALKVIFSYLEKEKLISVGVFYKDFYVIKEEVPIITLMPDQLQYLIHDKPFEDSLSKELQICKDIFVFGCTVALRYSDLIHLEWKNFECNNGVHYLVATSQKTRTVTRVKLPDYAVAIVDKFRKRRAKKVFPYISLAWFNNMIRRISEKAKWTQEIGKSRSRRGAQSQILHPVTRKPYRFCDLVSSHVMRKTAITTMLMHGVPETVVKKISGHTGNSKAFYRYVNLVQSYLDVEVDKHFEKMAR